jgi:hypothetical protein
MLDSQIMGNYSVEVVLKYFLGICCNKSNEKKLNLQKKRYIIERIEILKYIFISL